MPDEILAYHQLSKHRFDRYAPGPGRLDWANQPDPFRRYAGAPGIPLPLGPSEPSPGFAQSIAGQAPIAPLSLATLARLLQDSLALAAWKRFGDSRWALRVNPSSGNLHPTEGYVLADLDGEPMIAHYTPREHRLEIRARLPPPVWRELARDLPAGGFFIGLSSITWREAWKYGERAFRYCHHDVGHALAAVAIAAAGLGWRTRLLRHVGTARVARLLGLEHEQGPYREHADCLLAVYPRDAQPPAIAANADLSGVSWLGEPNALSAEYRAWPWVEQMPSLTARPDGAAEAEHLPPHRPPAVRAHDPVLRSLVRQRRSAVGFDGRGAIAAADFHALLESTMPAADRAPFAALGGTPRVHLLLFVHRVNGVAPGLYFLARRAGFRPPFRADFEWQTPPDCPPDLPLFRLVAGDARDAARALCCHQDIAADGCFSLGMLAELEGTLRAHGPWFYPRLFWEAGVIGQMLYLEAEARGVRGTGIGCFFDDPVHELCGLADRALQSLYHFTVGHPVEDTRLETEPPYEYPS